MIAELLLISDLLKANDTQTPPSTSPTANNGFNPFKKKEKMIKGVLDEPGTAFGELKFKKYF